jgi:hypothetical protein
VDVRSGGKAVRDAINNVKIAFLITGDFPGDEKPKPVAFPDPREAAVAGDKYRIVSLHRLVEMKLASGMTASHRLQDLADVLGLSRAADLPHDFVARLDPYVRDKPSRNHETLRVFHGRRRTWSIRVKIACWRRCRGPGSAPRPR